VTLPAGRAGTPVPNRSAAALDRFLTDLLEQHTEETIAFRRRLHMHPELSQVEYETTETIATRLNVAGLPVVVQPSKVGLTSDVAADADGPRIALRADIDALPLPDHKDVPYASTVPGVSHACGHDAHTTIVLGAGLALDALRRAAASDPDLPAVGPVRLIFQSSEEKAPGGARAIIAAGGLDRVDAILGLHCDPTLTVGQVGVRTGAVTSAVDRVALVLRGPGGHTARPDLTVNLLEAAGRVLVELPSRVHARLPSSEGHARLVFGMVAGGHAPNVIPTEVSIEGTFRTLHPHVWAQAQPVVASALADVLADYEVDIQLGHERGAPPVVNDPTVTDVLSRAITAGLGDAALVAAEPSMGGEDFSFYLEAVPGTYCRLGVAAPGLAGSVPPLHTSGFDIDEGALAVGIRTLVHVVLAAQRELGASHRTP
jgi:amidohydrolase